MYHYKMDISGSQDQMNSMIETMDSQNQAIKKQNTDLLAGYQKAVTDAGSGLAPDVKKNQDQAMAEAGLNVPAKFGKTGLAIQKAGGFGKYIDQETKGIQRVGSLAKQGIQALTTPKFKPGGGMTRDFVGNTPADMPPMASAQAGDDPRYADADPSRPSGDLVESNFSEDPVNESFVAKPTSSSTPAQTIEEATEKGVTAEGKGDSVMAKLTGGASGIGTALSVAGGVMDLTQDLQQHKIAGNNWEEKASNVSGMVAGGIDAVSEAIPLLAPLGALAGVFSAVTESIGLAKEKENQIKSAKANVSGTGTGVSDKQTGMSTSGLQSEGLIASAGAKSTAPSYGGSGAF